MTDPTPADRLPMTGTPPGHDDRTDCWCNPTVGWPGHPLGLVHNAEKPLPKPSCCELACYEDPGCACDGCQPAHADTAALDHSLHFDPDCEECVYLARPTVIRVPARADTAALVLIREGIDTFGQNDGHHTSYIDDEWRCDPDCPACGWVKRAREYAALEATDD